MNLSTIFHVLLIILCTASASQAQQITADKHYLFFLHHKFVELNEPGAVHPEYGKAEYQEILERFRQDGFHVISEKRPANTDVKEYARKVTQQVNDLLRQGVKPGNISVVGSSKGGYIAQYVSTYLRNPDINFAFIGCYQATDLTHLPDIQFCGNILNVYEVSDSFGVSAIKRKEASSLPVPHFAELELHTGLRHGFLYHPLDEWMIPVARWCKGDYQNFPRSSKNPVAYGDNPAAGKYIELNGINHYYEVYGNGPPLLLIHGNGTGIKGHAPQIDYFSTKYKVYAVDNRGRGKTELGKDTRTYLQQAKDLAVFIGKMKLDSVCLVGKSDGGIIALLLGIYYPRHVSKIVAFGANISPDTNALYARSMAEMSAERQKAEQMLAAKDSSKNWRLQQQRYRLMEFQPHIGATDLQQIQAPVLVISCDRDVIKLEHTLFIYNHIPKANLAILPGETHFVARQNAALFNQTIDKFLSEPYKESSVRFAAP